MEVGTVALEAVLLRMAVTSGRILACLVWQVSVDQFAAFVGYLVDSVVIVVFVSADLADFVLVVLAPLPFSLPVSFPLF